MGAGFQRKDKRDLRPLMYTGRFMFALGGGGQDKGTGCQIWGGWIWEAWEEAAEGTCRLGLQNEASRVEAGCGNRAKPQLQQCNWHANNWDVNRTGAGPRATSAGESECVGAYK